MHKPRVPYGAPPPPRPAAQTRLIESSTSLPALPEPEPPVAVQADITPRPEPGVWESFRLLLVKTFQHTGDMLDRWADEAKRRCEHMRWRREYERRLEEAGRDDGLGAGLGFLWGAGSPLVVWIVTGVHTNTLFGAIPAFILLLVNLWAVPEINGFRRRRKAIRAMTREGWPPSPPPL